MQALLYWSEYFNGKWQPTKTSDVNLPTELESFALDAFDRTKLRLRTREESDDPLQESDVKLRVILDGQGSASFLLYNTHSLPVRNEDAPEPPPVFVGGADRTLSTATGDQTFTINYYKYYGLDVPPTKSQALLKNPIPDWALGPQHSLKNPWYAPFFYTDSDHVFYVTTQKVFVPVQQWHLYYVPGLSVLDVSIPPLIMPELQPPGPGPYEFALIGSDDPSAMKQFVSEDAYITKGIASTGIVHFGATNIGPAGAIDVSAIEEG